MLHFDNHSQKPLSINWKSVIKALKAHKVCGDGEAFLWHGVSIDSRTLQKGQIFIALNGVHFDGHNFIAAALARDCCALVVHKDRVEEAVQRAEEAACNIPILAVEDCFTALHDLATFWRNRFNIPVIAVCGSNGKTTVKAMLLHILEHVFGPEKGGVLATKGNQNNHIGVPLTLLQLLPHHRFAVVEIGMNHSGEISDLAHLARPTIALVNNAQREHQEFLSGIAATAEENGNVFLELNEKGIAVLPINNESSRYDTALNDTIYRIWNRQIGARKKYTFEILDDESQSKKTADISAHITVANSELLQAQVFSARGEKASLTLPPGRHFLHNALAAISCVSALGVALASAADGLLTFEPVQGRMSIYKKSNYTVIDDTYNANPDSIIAALDVLALAQGVKVFVLADMGEVGADNAVDFHREVGAYARNKGITYLIALGEFTRFSVDAFGEGATLSNTHQALILELLSICQKGTFATILVKGSRAMKMEEVVTALLDKNAEALVGH